jgi:hypothetical protein
MRKKAPWIVLTALILAALACTSNDTLFIKLTQTPVPTATPTALAFNTRYKASDQLYIVGSSFQIPLNSHPSVVQQYSSAVSSACFPGTQVTVLDASKNRDEPSDPLIYYNVQCGSAAGWVPEFTLTLLKPNSPAVVKSPDGKGATIYSDADAKSKPVSEQPCPEGTSAYVGRLTLNTNTRSLTDDTNIYAEVTCGDLSGYALESALAPEAK